ncbi:MAG TPA: glycoside hydrolase family 16 protein [Solirubrobacterales bacterium]|nr:glycoside hydrolase family 16 protein [Solirubrobacterales bacterium]
MFRRFLLLAVFAVVCVVATLMVTSADEPPTADAQASLEGRPSGPECGTEVSAEEWICTFADDFDGKELDRSRWAVMETARTGFSHAYECYVDEPETVSVGDGLLSLTAHKRPEGNLCGAYPTPYVSGMVHTQGLFSQTYGRFEARIKFPEGSGLHGAWWMWPQDMAYGRQSGEIDIAEHWGMFPNIVSPYAHIIGPQGEERGKGAYCLVADPEGSFHTYAVEWTPPGRMEFLYDGETCMTFENWNPGEPLAYPQPFDQPFFMILTMALQFGAVDDNTPFPATMNVDYVRAWAPAPPPEDSAPPPPPGPSTDEPTNPDPVEPQPTEPAS